jgi:formylglycine-generating enzyme required for sulfatase activity
LADKATDMITPATIGPLTVGHHEFTLKKDGYKDAGFSVQVRKDEIVKVQARFTERIGPQPGQAWTALSVGMELVWIPAGTFYMGSADGANDEQPVHRVTFSNGFWMGKYEVTQAQWEQVMGNNNPSNFKGENLPVECVSWHDCVAFCAKLTAQERQAGKLPDGYRFRLPTEAEWEYACRAGTTTKYYTGDSGGDLARAGWYYGNSGQTTHPVGKKQANNWGLHDMHGNVWEWCADWYDAYSGAGITDPTVPASGQYRVVRGGSWGSCVANRCRAAYRSSYTPDLRYDDLGVRVVVEAPRF